jgi:hypothetical protein
MERTELIRKGNEEFNKLRERWDYAVLKNVTEYFTEADYQDGLFRLGDYLTYDKHMPLLGMSYYKKIGNTRARERLNELHQRMLMSVRTLIKQPD